MKLNLNPALTAPRRITAESEALAGWYDAHPTVRRLWAIRNGRSLSVIVTLEPTMDNGDVYPAWFACSKGWAREMESIAGNVVNLQLLDEPSACEFEVDLDGEVVAAMSWRDPTYFWKAD